MNPATVMQLLSFATQFMQTTHVLSPSNTTSTLTGIFATIAGAYDKNTVLWLQRVLNSLFNANLNPDGKLGAKTETAVLNALSRIFSLSEAQSVLLPAVKLVLAKL
jgi:lysozyme family protein